MASASLRISTLYLGIVTLGLFPALPGFADEASEIENAPEIEAKAYELKTIRPSKSGRVYLFQKTEDGFPVDGKIFLLRQGDTPVMAFRVLKTYPKTKRIAAKKLLPYEGFAKLERGSEYRAYEKVGDKVAPVPPSPEDLSDLKELEGGSPEDVPPPPTEGNPPGAEPSTPPENEVAPDVELRDSKDEYESDEVGDYFPNFFTMAVGLFGKMKVPGPDEKFAGGFLYSRNLNESFALEGGFFYYQSSGDENGSTVKTTVMPFVANLRYQWRSGEIWTPYVYGGLTYPLVTSNVGATKRQLAEIQTTLPSFGVGTFLQTGPNWYMRFDLGYNIQSESSPKKGFFFGFNSMTLGVALRF